jgi:vancomycin resistance protein YoaR
VYKRQELNSSKIEPIIEVKEPEVTLENANQAKIEAEAIIAGGELTLRNGEKSYLIDVDTISSWITALPNGEDLVIDLDRTKLKDFLKTVAQSIDVGPQDAMLSVVNGKVAISQASRDGATVDIDASASKIASAILSRIVNKSSTVSKDITIEVKITKPSVTSETLASLGLNDMIGTGTTSFTGSPSNRVTNITVGARLLNGSLIKPGEQFSTLAHLGTIDASSGYLPELVIKENRTVPEYGGGLCQVSTTLFRAALNAGLQIDERQNHKYRVSYYEPPVGMDATIYDPAPDFKFTNDTPGYILVQSKVAGTKITFEFYGTKDGRTVNISSPVISNITAPPEPLMEPTDTLPIGETKQVEKAHDGSDASFAYTVTRNSQVIHNVTFTSHYVPWRARILVGTGPAAPEPTPPADAVAPTT